MQTAAVHRAQEEVTRGKFQKNEDKPESEDKFFLLSIPSPSTRGSTNTCQMNIIMTP